MVCRAAQHCKVFLGSGSEALNAVDFYLILFWRQKEFAFGVHLSVKCVVHSRAL